MGYARRVPSFDNTLSQGTVQSVDNDNLLVAGSFGLMHAQRAESCLLKPEVRDRVLIAELSDGSAWVLAVLKRKTCEAELVLPSQTHLVTERLALQTKETTISTSKLALHGENVELAGDAVAIKGHLLSLAGEVLLQGFTVIRSLARSLYERIGRRSARYNSVSCKVEELAEQKAGRIRVCAEQSYRLRAENADLAARSVMDIDAKQIKVG